MNRKEILEIKEKELLKCFGHYLPVMGVFLNLEVLRKICKMALIILDRIKVHLILSQKEVWVKEWEKV